MPAAHRTAGTAGSLGGCDRDRVLARGVGQLSRGDLLMQKRLEEQVGGRGVANGDVDVDPTSRGYGALGVLTVATEAPVMVNSSDQCVAKSGVGQLVCAANVIAWMIMSSWSSNTPAPMHTSQRRQIRAPASFDFANTELRRFATGTAPAASRSCGLSDVWWPAGRGCPCCQRRARVPTSHGVEECQPT